MNQSKYHTCTCTRDGYSPDCPSVFVQDGKLLHTIDNENRLKPREYKTVESAIDDLHARVESLDVLNNLDDGDSIDSAGIRSRPEPDATTIGTQYECVRVSDFAPDPVRFNNQRNAGPQFPNMYDTNHLLAQNRASLKKFEALRVDGQTLTSLSIGGYAVDLGKASEKAGDIVPLPPSKLPIIFKDDEMNFYHHFFQGLEIMFGRENLELYLSKKKYYDDIHGRIIASIEHLIKAGYRSDDTELTLFTKKVLTSTFSIPRAISSNNDSRYLIVDANLWGFQYIESGMQMRDVDLQMWLSISHGHFRTLWFNTFKSSGVPSFALEGVQTRYRTLKFDDKLKERVREVPAAVRTALDQDGNVIQRKKQQQKTRKPIGLISW